MKPKLLNLVFSLLFCLPRRESVANAEVRLEECANADLESALEPDADGWFKCSNYGVFRGSKPGRMQHFGQPEAQRMVEEFNSLRGKLGRMWRGLPIFIGHPDVNRQVWSDERRLGKVVDMQARGDGFWTRGDWNALGRENIANGYWVYPSPRWDAPEGSSEFRPDRLLSIGMTNMPRIKTSEPVANAEGGEDAAAADATAEISPNNNTDMDRKLLIEKMGLAPEATDEEILAKIDAMLAAVAEHATSEKAKLDAAAGETLQAENASKEKDAALAAARSECANARVDLAIAEGRITLADRPTWIGRLSGDHRESEANALGAIKPLLNTKALALVQTRQEVGDEHKRRESVANAVAKVQSEKGCGYTEAFAVVRKDPAMKPIFDAMHESGREE